MEDSKIYYINPNVLKKYMLNNKNIWERIFKEDILYDKHKNILGKCLDLKKTLKYFTGTQMKGGYFHKDSPMVYNTFYFCGMLNCLKKEPSKKTIEYIRSLQVGSVGFSETTGEVPWTDKAYLAIQMFDWFNIPLQKKNELVSFFQDFQNMDGGFGSLSHENSNFYNTVETIFILSRLGSKPRSIEKAIHWLKDHTRIDNPFLLFQYIQSLTLLDYKFGKEEKHVLINKIRNFLNNFELDYGNKYYCIKSLLFLDQPIKDYTHIIENKNITNNVIENYYLSELLSIYDKIEDFQDKFYPYTKKYELRQGGFSTKDEISIIKNGFMIHSLHLMDCLDMVDTNKFVEWLLAVANEDGWGPRSHTKQYHEYTVTSLIALRLIGKNKVKNKEGIVKKAEQELDNALNFPYHNNYHVLRTIKNSLERLMLLNVKPVNLFKIVNRVMEYCNEDGGFGGRNKPYLYATLWAVRSLYLCEKYLKYSNKMFFSKLDKIRTRTSDWINSCQNEDGGFGPMPNQPSNIQSTFCALYSLWMLNNKPRYVKKAV